jgi:DNA-binding transcriptional ArsR family regulator
MNITVLKEIDPVYEANVVLSLMAEGFSFEDLRESLLKKVRGDNGKVKDIFKRIIKIYHYIEKHLADDMERISFYYKNIGEYSDNIASFVHLYDTQFINYTIQDIREYVLNISEEDRRKQFSNRLNGFYKIGLTDEETDDITTVDLFRKINGSELNAEEKLLIQQIFLDKEKYLTEILDIIERTIKLMERFSEDICAITDQFYEYWNSFLTKENFYKYMQKNTNITIEENAKGTYFTPNIFYCNQCSFSSKEDNGEDKDYNKAAGFDVFRIGVLFDDNFQIRSQTNDLTAVNQALKLLSDKSKFEILMLIKENSAYGIELAKSMNLSTPTISYHMSALIQSGLVKIEKSNNKVFYTSNRERIDELLKQIRQYLVE